MKIKFRKKSLLLLPIAASFLFLPINSSLAADNKPEMKLILNGTIDLDSPVVVGQPYLLKGRLVGGTTFSHAPVYGGSKGSNNWDAAYPIVALSSSSYQCMRNDVVPIPNSNGKWGYKLIFQSYDQSNADPIDAWLVPSLNYTIIVKNTAIDKNLPNAVKSMYSGRFFYSAGPDGLSDRYTVIGEQNRTGSNTCLTPPENTRTDAGGSKVITISAGGIFELYSAQRLRPGKFAFSRDLFITSSLSVTGGDAQAPFKFETDLNIVRICKITNVTGGDRFNETMGRENQILRESKFTYTCTADNRALFMSAIVHEGTLSKTDKRKLFFDLQGGGPADNAPWLLARPYTGVDGPALSCKDEGNPSLLSFDNQDNDLKKMTRAGIAENMGIKWAICANDAVKAGKYRARVEIAVFTKA